MKIFLSPNDLGARPLAVKTEQINSINGVYLVAPKDKLVTMETVTSPSVDTQTTLEPINPQNNISPEIPSPVNFEQAKIEPQPVSEIKPQVSPSDTFDGMFYNPIQSTNQFDNSGLSNGYPASLPVDQVVPPTPVIEIEKKIEPVSTVVLDENIILADKVKLAYLVEKGDTIEEICKKFGYNVPNFLAYNKLSITTSIMQGMILFLPFSDGEFTKADEIIYERINKKIIKLAKSSKLNDAGALSGLNNSGELNVSSNPNVF